jgi:hypothetical protein
MSELLAHRKLDARAALHELAAVIGTTLTDYPLSGELVRSNFRLDQG